MDLNVIYVVCGVAATVAAASFGLGFTFGGKFQTKEKCEAIRMLESEKESESIKRLHERIDSCILNNKTV